ncbi:MAG: hypothetical protein M1536_07765 [Firmicutes bacterium]|nr:hypothetical protein [Bacillota bacterium]
MASNGSVVSRGLALITIICLLMGQISYAETLAIQVGTIPTAVAADTPINIAVQVSGSGGSPQVYLNYRIRGESTYAQVIMQQTGFQGFYAVIPSQFVTISGVEFYIQASAQSGAPPVTAPSVNPQQNPFVIVVQADTFSPVVTSMSPSSGVTIPDSPPEIAVEVNDAAVVSSGIDISSAKMLVDGAAVHINPQILEADAVNNALRARFVFQPEAPLSNGQHSVGFEVKDRSKNKLLTSWSFTIKQGAGTVEKKLKTIPVTVHGSQSYSGISTEGTGNIFASQRGMNSTGNLTMDFSSKVSDYLTVDGTFSTGVNTLQALDDQTRKIYPLSVDRYAVRFRTQASLFTLGDAYTEIPYLVMGSPSVRGISYESRPAAGRLRYMLFIDPERTPVSSFVGTLPTSSVVRQSRMGARAEWQLSKNHTISLNFLNTQDKVANISGGDPSLLESQIFALSGKWMIFNRKGTITYAVARSDEQQSIGNQQKVKNHAIAVRADIPLTERLSIYADYSYIQPFYGQLSVFGQDQDRIDSGLSYRIGNYVTARAGYLTNRNNLLGQIGRTTANRAPSWSVTANFPKWPSISINGRRNRSFTDDFFNNNTTNDFGYSVYYYSSGWDASVFGSQSSNRVWLGFGSNSDSSFVVRNLTIRPFKRWSFITRLTTSEFINTDTRETTTNNEPAYGAIYQLIPGVVTLSGEFAKARSYSTSNTINTTRDTSTLSVNYYPHFRGGIFNYGYFSLSYQNIVQISAVSSIQDFIQSVLRITYQTNF